MEGILRPLQVQYCRLERPNKTHLPGTSGGYHSCSPYESPGTDFVIVNFDVCFVRERLLVLGFPTCCAMSSSIDIGVSLQV